MSLWNFLVDTLLLYIPLLTLTDRQNDRQRNKYTRCAWAGGTFFQLCVSVFECNEFVLVLVQIDLIHFEHSNRISSTWTKTNTNSLHSTSIHSILRKIGHMIQFVVHQFVRKWFQHSNCISSTWIKTNTNLLHSRSIHSVLHKNGHVIQIVVHQFVCSCEGIYQFPMVYPRKLCKF